MRKAHGSISHLVDALSLGQEPYELIDEVGLRHHRRCCYSDERRALMDPQGVAYASNAVLICGRGCGLSVGEPAARSGILRQEESTSQST